VSFGYKLSLNKVKKEKYQAEIKTLEPEKNKKLSVV
jgi:hypothetical protein